MIGGGLIGLEVASSARRLGAAVTVVEAAPLPLRGLLGPEVGLRLAAWHREDGADLRLGAALAVRARRRATRRTALEELVLADGSRIATDHVVVAVGVRPEAAWLEGSGLAARAGSRTALPHVYAAGDVTGGGHWEAAARQGAGVARALLGLAPAPPAPPSFWSDQLGLRLQCVGDARRRPRHDRRRPRGPRLRGGLPARGPHQRRPARRPLRGRPARRPPSPDPRTPAREERRMTLIPEIDTFACVAHGDCAVVAPQAFRVDDVAVVVGVAPDECSLAGAAPGDRARIPARRSTRVVRGSGDVNGGLRRVDGRGGGVRRSS